MTTKEKIIDEALTLFSKKGYSGVSIKEIADAVGIKDSSIYKHFKSKNEIFQIILSDMTDRMDKIAPFPANQEMTMSGEYFSQIDDDGIVNLSKNIFLFYLKDNHASRFRRMLTIEQYNDSEVSALYKKIFFFDSITYQANIFDFFIKRGYFKKSDPEIVAMYFYSSIFMLICRYDNCPEKEDEALFYVEKHVREFIKIYKNGDE